MGRFWVSGSCKHRGSSLFNSSHDASQDHQLLAAALRLSSRDAFAFLPNMSTGCHSTPVAASLKACLNLEAVTNLRMELKDGDANCKTVSEGTSAKSKQA